MGEHDLISRSALYQQARYSMADNPYDNSPMFGSLSAVWRTTHKHILKIISNAHAVDAEPVRHGRWTECDWVMYDGHSECIHFPKAAWRCSACCNAFKKQFMYKRNYCPNCGAKMNVEVQDD